MSGELLFIIFILTVAMLAVLIAKLASFLRAFAADTRYICHEMDRAGSYEEYRKWRGELRCHYLCLIPFVTTKNVMRVHDRICRRADKCEKKERKDSLAPLLMPSILGICLCLVCVCGMTWAWYTASVQTSTQKMTAAYYEVTVDFVKNGNDEIIADDGVYNLEADTTYTVKLTARGSVDKCGGYCLIQNTETETGEKIYTQTFEPDDSIVVFFKPSAPGKYTFTGVWGSLPKDTQSYLRDKDSAAAPINDLESSDTAEPAPTEPADQPSEPFDGTYTVKEGDTLLEIARNFSTSVDKIAAYNGIANTRDIKVGQVLTIPPQDYVIPESVPGETEPPADVSVTEPVTEPVTDAPVVTEPSDTESASSASTTPADSSIPDEPSAATEE